MSRVLPVRERPRLDQPERRRSARVELAGDVVGSLATSDVPILVREAGREGFSVETAQPFAVGAEQAFRFTAGNGQVTVIRAICRHCMRMSVTLSRTLYLAGFELSPHQLPGQLPRALDRLSELE
jgi:hypothetical protein